MASINDAGTVAFQAECADGSSGIFVAHAGEAQPVVTTYTGDFTAFNGHPDIKIRVTCASMPHSQMDRRWLH